jgi:two-component system, sensor histidine kinase PdtaS
VKLPAAVATPLALVLTELLQNAVGHAFRPSPDGEPPDRPGDVLIELASEECGLRVRVVDDGTGLPPGFDLERSTGLGLSIVRTLVRGELGGSMAMGDRQGDGTRGTVIELQIPSVAS